MTKLITTDHKINLAKRLKESLGITGSTYYLGALNHHIQDEIPFIESNYQDVAIQTYYNLLFGKKIEYNDCELLIRNIPYESNKIYERYDDKEILENKDFYCIVDETSYFHVFKCLDNNNRANSTISPQFSFVSQADNYVFRTADGYLWKYMYSVPDTIVEKFSSEYYFPVVANSNVQNDAINGSIHVIAIDDAGKGYHNYFNGTFLGTDIRISGNDLLYRVNSQTLSHSNNFYNGCLIYLSEGTGSGQYRTIESYITNSSGYYITIDEPFDIVPTNGTEYQVTPKVIINGHGTNLKPAAARAIVDPLLGNSISTIEMLDVGENYAFSTATIAVDESVGVEKQAFVRPIYSPAGGHGSDPYSELMSSSLEFSVKFANNEINTIPAENVYQGIALIQDPTFTNVLIEFDNFNGTFITGETVISIDPLMIAKNVNINTSSHVISGSIHYLSNAEVIGYGISGSYEIGDILTISGGTPVIPAQVIVNKTLVRSVDIENAGNNFTNGEIATLTTGTGTSAYFSITTDSNGVPVSLSIDERGEYTVSPSLSNVATTTSENGEDLYVSVNMGVAEVEIYNPGSYALIPAFVSNNNPQGGNGFGAELNLTFESEEDSVNFDLQFNQGDLVYITNKDNTQRQLSKVISITNSTYMEIESNGVFACSESIIYHPRKNVSFNVSNIPSAGYITLTDVPGYIETNTQLLGVNSFAFGTVNSFSINDVDKSFNTFIGMYKYNVEMSSGSFVVNEQVYEGSSLENSTANALIHSIDSNTGDIIIFCSNQKGTFSNTIIGSESFAVATLIKQYEPDIKFNSGKILYLESFEPIERDITQTEQFKVIFDL